MDKQIIAPPQTIQRREQYNSLNGLRAIAAICIVVMHVQANMPIKPDFGWVSEIIGSFSMFILLFMIISAFSMCCGYYGRVKNNQISPNDFYKKRAKRILPFFALMTVIDVILEHNISSLLEGFSNLTLFFNFFQADIKVIGVGWFIGVICVFYMLFPCFVMLMDNKTRALATVVVSIILTSIAVNYFNIDFRGNFSLYFPFFAIGGLIYVCRKDIIKITSSHYLFTLLGCLIITCLYFAMGASDPLMKRMEQLLMFSAWTIFAISKDNIVLNNKVMNFLSGISMEIYLCHMMFFRVVQKSHVMDIWSNTNLNYIIACILTLIGACAFSYIVKYKCINILISKSYSKK